MPTLKNIGIVAGLVTGGSGVASGIAYSLGAFHPSIQVIELIKKENKHVLLSSDATEWKIKWQEYKVSDKPWGDFEAAEDQIPENFKTTCNAKSKEVVYGINDTNYKNITKYCAKDKTIFDLLKEQNFRLLDTKGEVETWKKRFEEYKSENNKPKLPNVSISPTETKEEHYAKISKGCEDALQIKTTVARYESNIDAIKEWCKA